MKRTLARIACLLLLAACAGPRGRAASGPPCRWPSAPVVIHQAADTVFLSWSYRADQLPGHAAPGELPALAAFLDTVRLSIDVLEPRALLDRQIGYYASRPDADSQGEAANGRSVATGAVGTLRPISCVEALLVEFQSRRHPMASRPTEFQAIVMERAVPGARELRVYFAGSSAPWPPRGDRLFERVAADRRTGWRAITHLHNHPFYLTSQGDIAGANAPSLTDVQFWRYLRDVVGVESARITNGVSTFEALAPEFDRLRARERSP